MVDDRPGGAGVRGRAARALGRLRARGRDDRRRGLDRLRAALLGRARRRALPADGRRGPGLRDPLGERERPPRRLREGDARRGPPLRRALARPARAPGRNGPRDRAPDRTFTPSVKGFSMNTGTVKFYNDQRGFGFIAPDRQADVDGPHDFERVAFFDLAPPRQHLILLGVELGADERGVPTIGVSGHQAQQPLLTHAAEPQAWFRLR